MTLPEHRTEVVGDLYGVFRNNLFLAPRHHRATGQSTCGAARTLTEGGADLGYRGCHDVILLELAGSQMLPDKM